MTTQSAALLELSPGAQIVAFDSSTREKTYRVELSTGVHFQINEKLFHVLDCLRTPMPLSSLAAEFQQRTGQSVALDQLQSLSAHLIEQGIVTPAGLGEHVTVKANPPAQPASAYLGLHYRRDLFAAETLAPLARAFDHCHGERNVASRRAGDDPVVRDDGYPREERFIACRDAHRQQCRINSTIRALCR